jgi:hypothetical protein
LFSSLPFSFLDVIASTLDTVDLVYSACL